MHEWQVLCGSWNKQNHSAERNKKVAKVIKQKLYRMWRHLAKESDNQYLYIVQREKVYPTPTPHMGIKIPIQYDVHWAPKILHPKQDLDPFSHFRRVQACGIQTDKRHTTKILAAVDRISCPQCNWRWRQQFDTSMPSRFMMALSILSIAALMVFGGGRTVRPMLMTLDRFASRTANSFLAISAFYISYTRCHILALHTCTCLQAKIYQHVSFAIFHSQLITYLWNVPT